MSEINENESLEHDSLDKIKAPNKVWKKDYNPIREIVLWGWDKEKNPSFLILYGEQGFKETNSDGYTTRNILEDHVNYTGYAVFKGKSGHLPSFQSVTIIESGGYGKSNEDYPKMYYKTGVKNGWYWSADENYLVDFYRKLTGDNIIKLPYFTEVSYEELVSTIKSKNIDFENFTIADSPKEVLNLDEELAPYYETLCELMCRNNLYIRKKRLVELLEKNPPREIYELLLKIGSTELLSGLFLDFAAKKDNMLIEDAEKIIKDKAEYGDESYMKGLRRCASIYINSMNEELKAERYKEIIKDLPKMDLHLTGIDGNVFPKGKILEGARYRKYAAQELLREEYYRYDYNSRKYLKSRAPKRYEESIYSDGVILNIVELKNTLQEAEYYGFADVIGKIAYYLDAPRLTYYFKGNSKGKALKYFKRYIKRVIDSYAENEPEKFMEVMKNMLTSYTQYDYVCKFKGNFQFNELMKYYLYQDFKEKAPEGWDNWYARFMWMQEDQLAKLEGRYEFHKDIWDNHLEDVLYIATKAQIPDVLKACYFILRDSEQLGSLIDNISYDKLIELTGAAYEPLADMFMDILKNKLDSVETFDAKLMISLINSSCEDINKLAVEFFDRTQGRFAADDVADLMLLDNLEKWIELLEKNINSLSGDNYLAFIKAIIYKNDEFKKKDINISKEISDMLLMSTEKIISIEDDKKAEFISYVIKAIYDKGSMMDWTQKFLEEVIFTLSYDELDRILGKVEEHKPSRDISKKNAQIVSVLNSIKNKTLLSDSQIISILETGTSKLIKALLEIIDKNTEAVKKRFGTILIMLECDITMLNYKAKNIFESLDKEEQKKLHAVILDSPVKKVYEFGIEKLNEIYGEVIPKEFIIQMMEHNSYEVKAYISKKSDYILENLGCGNKDLFVYYAKTLLLLPNKVSKSKNHIYDVLPAFVSKYAEERDNIEKLLLDIGGSNSIIDSERALITLAKIRKEAVTIEG